MGFQCTRGARGVRIAWLGGGAKRCGDIPRADSSRPQENRAIARQVDDRRFDADLARAAVQDQIDLFAEIVTHVLSCSRADAAEFVGGWSRNPTAELAQQLESDRVAGDAQADRVLAAGELIAHTQGALQNQGQRPRPEARCEFPCAIGNLARPAGQLPGVADVNDDGVAGGTTLYSVDARDR